MAAAAHNSEITTSWRRFAPVVVLDMVVLLTALAVDKPSFQSGLSYAGFA
jgi:hypothetical protein